MVRAVSDNNNDSTARRPDTFTPGTATKMLPLVRRIVHDMRRLSDSINAQREQLEVIDELPETIDQPDYQEELTDIRRSLAKDEERLNHCQDELAALGLQTHDPFDGSVDFPAEIKRRRIQLCWNPEDEKVEYWHEVGQSKEHRQKVDPAMFDLEALN